MRYWDSSALVPLLVREPFTFRVERWLAEDPHIATWIWTRVEVIGAIERRVREGQLTREQRRAALRGLDQLEADWDEITDVLVIRSRASSLLARHPLRAADAGQLAAALEIQDQIPEGPPFVCLDRNLCLAAEREGLHVLGAET